LRETEPPAPHAWASIDADTDRTSTPRPPVLEPSTPAKD